MVVFDMEDRTATFEREVLDNLTEYLSVKLAEGGYQVIPRDQVRDRLVREKRGTYLECFDKSCQIEMGRELAAQKVLSARILKIAGRCQLAATLYDLKKAATEKAASAEGACDEESMGRAVMKVSAKFSGKAASDFDDYLTAAKKKIDDRRRAGEAWKVIRAIAEDPKEPLESRIAGLEKFIDEFGERNPHRDQALALLDKLSKLEPASLSIRTHPDGARIRIDGHDAGVSPLTVDLEGGEHRLEASLTGHSRESKTVSLAHGKTAEVSMELTRLGTLKVETDPPGSRVFIEGEEVGTAPLEKELKPGQYFVAVKAEDHFPQGKRVEVSSGKATEVRLTLEYAPPYSRWGHITFWSGLGVAAFGAVSGYLAKSAGDDYQAGDRGAHDRSVALAGCMYTGLAAGGALIITGVILWVLAPDEDAPLGAPSGASSVLVLPSPEGGLVFSLGGRF